MSRSRRHSPWMGTGSPRTSEKWDKQMWHRAFRHKTRQAMLKGQEPPHSPNEIVELWSMSKDGKARITNPRYMRK